MASKASTRESAKVFTKKDKKGYNVWQWNGSYIKGNLIKEGKSLATCKSFSKSLEDFACFKSCEDEWLLLNKDGMPIGLICEESEDE